LASLSVNSKGNTKKTQPLLFKKFELFCLYNAVV